MEAYLKRLLFDPTVGKLIAVTAAFFIVQIAGRLLRRHVADGIKNTDTRYRVRKSITYAGYFLFFVLVTVIFSDKLGGMTVALGVAGAGVAFALQEVIASIAGWIAISFGNFYRVGDRVQLGGIVGDVIDIGILRSTLMECGQWVKSDQYNGRIVRIANSFVFKEPVFNYSGDFPFLWDEIAVPVKYGSDRAAAEQILQRVIDETSKDYASEARGTWLKVVGKYMIEEAVIEPTVIFSFSDNWMEFTLRYIVDYKMRRATKNRLYRRILEEFDKTEGRVSIASSTFGLVEAPAIDVRIMNSPGRHANKGDI